MGGKGGPAAKKAFEIIQGVLGQTSMNLEDTQYFTDQTNAISLERILDRRIRGFMVTVYQAILAVENIELALIPPTESNINMKYAGLMVDVLALSYTGLLLASNLSKGRKLSYQDVRGQSLRLQLPELIRNRILERTAVLYKPIKHSNKRDCINQGQVAISIWYNFYLVMMLAVTRRDDSYFDKSSINNLSNIPPKELASIQTWLGSLWGMTNV
jgi:hypothetical protein